MIHELKTLVKTRFVSGVVIFLKTSLQENMNFLPKKWSEKKIMTFVNLINQNIRQVNFDMFKLTIRFQTNGLSVSFLLVILVG